MVTGQSLARVCALPLQPMTAKLSYRPPFNSDDVSCVEFKCTVPRFTISLAQERTTRPTLGTQVHPARHLRGAGICGCASTRLVKVIHPSCFQFVRAFLWQSLVWPATKRERKSFPHSFTEKKIFFAFLRLKIKQSNRSTIT
jgi:hypothetical protein